VAADEPHSYLNGDKMEKLHPALRHQRNSTSLTLALKTVTILAATAIIFSQDLAIIANDALQSEFMSYMLAIPFLFTYLIYRKRKMVRATTSLKSPEKKISPYKEVAGALLFLTAFLTYSYGSYTFTPLEYHMFALPIFVAACTLIMFNTQTLRQLAFPILFLFFLTPPPTEIVNALGSTLSTVSTQATCATLNLFGLAAKASTTYGNPTITITQPNGTPLSFTIDIECSGIHSLISFLIFATLIAYIARTKTWKKPAIFLIALPLVYLLNILRITIVVLLGYYYGMELALNTFHLLGGWTLIFLGTLLLLIIAEKALKIQLFTKKQTVSCPECNSLTEDKQDFCPSCGRLLKYAEVKLSKLDLAKITAVAISVILIMCIQAPIFALTKGPADMLNRLASGQEPTTEILPQINNYTLKFVYRDKEFEQMAEQDAALTYAYTPTNNSENTVWVLLEIASTKSSLHPWEVCLITWPLSQGEQPEVTQLDLRDTQLIQNPPVTARYFAFKWQNYNVTEAVLYWHETSTFTANATTQQKHVRISLIVYPQGTESFQQAEDELLTLGKAIANYWQPMKTWAHIALLISQNGNILTAFPTAALIFTLSFYTINKRKEKKTNINAYKKIS
jgi:exosortase